MTPSFICQAISNLPTQTGAIRLRWESNKCPPCPRYTSTYYSTTAADCAYTVELHSIKDVYLHIEYCTSSFLFADLQEITCHYSSFICYCVICSNMDVIKSSSCELLSQGRNYWTFLRQLLKNVTERTRAFVS